MKKLLLSADAVKELLNVQDFRSVTKEKLIEFVSVIPNMDKDVAIKIIEQFPAFSEYAQVMVKQFTSISDRIMASNEKSYQSVMDAYGKTLQVLDLLAAQDDLSIEDRRWFIEKSVEILDRMAEFDRANKDFLSTVLKCGAYVLGGGLLLRAVVFGVNFKVSKLPKFMS